MMFMGKVAILKDLLYDMLLDILSRILFFLFPLLLKL